ncbi:TPA: GNAT family N-acetyltransferase [Candidatus Woesearchaeota archaeon]|nr:GNAT family N-acetyltransferase [Candidatus Woesearchaeota archaeon]
MVNITKPVTKNIEQIKEILSQWTEVEEVEKYITRISNEIDGKTEFNMQFWIAKEDETVVGVVGLCNPLPKILSFAKTSNPGEIKILYLDTQMQGKGIGKLLVGYVEKEADKQGYSELLVRSAERYRDTAYGFYEKLGYLKTGIVEGGEEFKKMQVFGKVL